MFLGEAMNNRLHVANTFSRSWGVTPADIPSTLWRGHTFGVSKQASLRYAMVDQQGGVLHAQHLQSHGLSSDHCGMLMKFALGAQATLSLRKPPKLLVGWQPLSVEAYNEKVRECVLVKGRATLSELTEFLIVAAPTLAAVRWNPPLGTFAHSATESALRKTLRSRH